MEIVTDMSTETFTRSKVFYGEERNDTEVYKGKTFKAAAKFLGAVYKNNVVLDQMAWIGIV